ncbi:MAG: LysM peptidoglycan-binding domain-containing protein [Gammaproteobacteria bacterium]|nr:LysM peptidoglycan-binding domain-containing protein [Gammaproteobacteria bacterium]
MKRNVLIITILLPLAGCATLTTEPPPKISTETPAVSVAVATPAAMDTTDTTATAVAPNHTATPASEDHASATSQSNNDALSPNLDIAAEDPGNIWDRIRAGFAMPDLDNTRIEQQLQWYVRNEEYLDRVVERAGPYMRFIVDKLEKEKIPLEIALLPIVESAYQPFAYSHGRASGIWQFIPSTAKRYGLEQNWWYDGRRDIYASTDAAIRLLSALRDEFNGDWLLALAAYNSGSHNVIRAIRLNQRKHKPTDFFSLKLPRETRAYVPKLLALKKIVANPEKYKLDLNPIADEPYFERVEVDSQIDLALVAKLSEIELDTIYHLNPGFNRWATAPGGPHFLLLPIENAETFRLNLAQYPAEKRLQWVRHQVKKGDTLKLIASHYQTTPELIKTINKLPSNKLRNNQSLMVPVASQALASYKLSATERLNELQNTPQNDGVKVTQTVKRGDTWWSIARRHNVGVKQLARWNGLAPRDKLVPGQSLVIWSQAQRHKAEPVSLTQIDNILIPDERNMVQRIGYRVRRGDSLARISRKFNVSVDQVRRWNRLATKSRLRIGQKILLYVDVTQTSG